MKKKIFIILFIMQLVSPAQAGEYVNCLTFDNNGYIVNSCNVKLNVQWSDQGFCNTGCSSSVPANGRSSNTPVQGDYTWGACASPKNPFFNSDGTFRCN